MSSLDLPLPKGFVRLIDVDSSIIQSLRYCSAENFTGAIINGYPANDSAPQSAAIMTRQAAKALSNAQKQFLKDGYCMVLYDSYRPQKAVNHFVTWSQDLSTQGQLLQSQFFPRVDKSKVFELGYIAERSGHSRGSTVDVTLIELHKTLCALQFSEREYPQSPGYVIPFLDDNTVDMGSSFDLFDEASHHDSVRVLGAHIERRNYLRRVMGEHGFRDYDQEWWHYTLRDEPFASTYFDFSW